MSDDHKVIRLDGSDNRNEMALKTFSSEYMPNSTILGKNTYLPIDFQHALNDNVIVMGSSGTGKTYSFVKPNLLQMNMNFVVADAKGEILADTGEALKKNGYNIRVLNLVNLKHSMSYNPLKYMNDDIDVASFADAVIKSTPDGEQQANSDDPFWDNGPKELLVALISYVREFLPSKEQNMNSVVDLFNVLDQPVTKNADMTIFENHLGYHLFEHARALNAQSYAVRKWDSIRGVAGSPHTWSSIVGILGAALAPYEMRDVVNLTYDDTIDFPALLKPKTALFVMYDDADNSKNFISNVFYKQLFAFLFHKSRDYKHQSLPVKVRFFLDDFKNVTIPGFDDYLATARSRNISVCIMLQDESQLFAKYHDNAPSIIGNCATYLLTGTTDLTMASQASVRFDKTANAIRRLDRQKFLIDSGGRITEDWRYDFRQHPNYVKQTYHLSNEVVIKNHLPTGNLSYQLTGLNKLIAQAQQSPAKAYNQYGQIVTVEAPHGIIAVNLSSGRRSIADSHPETLVGEQLVQFVKGSTLQIWPQLHLNSLIKQNEQMTPDQQKKNRALSVDYTVGWLNDNNWQPLAVIEVDGPSHFNDQHQMLNDEYKNRLLKQAKLPLYRISANSEWIHANEDGLNNWLKNVLQAKLKHDLAKIDLVTTSGITYQLHHDALADIQKLTDQELFDQLFMSV